MFHGHVFSGERLLFKILESVAKSIFRVVCGGFGAFCLGENAFASSLSCPDAGGLPRIRGAGMGVSFAISRFRFNFYRHRGSQSKYDHSTKTDAVGCLIYLRRCNKAAVRAARGADLLPNESKISSASRVNRLAAAAASSRGMNRR